VPTIRLMIAASEITAGAAAAMGARAMQVRGYFGEGEIIAPPRTVAPVVPATGLAMWPLALQSAFRYDPIVEELYRMAYEQARAIHRPTWYEQLLRTLRN
jgi:hypothetical protein